MKTKQRKEAKEDPRSRRAVVREFADEKSAGVVDAKPIWSGVALRRPGKDRPVCTHGARQRAAAARHRPPLPSLVGRSPRAGFLSAARSSLIYSIRVNPATSKTGPRHPSRRPGSGTKSPGPPLARPRALTARNSGGGASASAPRREAALKPGKFQQQGG